MNNQEIVTQEIFTTEERNENIKRKLELIKLVASGEAILIVGAGSSARVGSVTWMDLLKKLENFASDLGDDFKPNCENREKKPFEYAEYIKSYIREKTGNLKIYYAWLDESFDLEDRHHKLHETLVLLPFRGILTTNYDMVLESALIATGKAPTNPSLVINEDSAGQVSKFLMAMSDRCMPRRIAHLHGRYDYPKSIILSTEDYEEAYGLSITDEDSEPQQIKCTLHQRLLWSILAERRVVFVGFSMNDSYFNAMLDAVSKDLWRWGKSIHYAIMSISPKKVEDSKTGAKDLKNKYGVDTIFYEDFDKSHQGLDRIVKKIAEECCVEIQLPIESQDVLDWLEQVNERMERSIDDEN